MRHERRILCIVWHTDGCGCLFHGSCQCRRYVLCGVSPVRDLSLVAHAVAEFFGVSQEMFLIGQIPTFKITSAVKISVLAILCAGVSIIFCVMLHQSEHLYKKFFKNPYVRIFAGGCFVLILTLLVGNQNYNGTGINIIEQCIDGTVRPEAFYENALYCFNIRCRI